MILKQTIKYLIYMHRNNRKKFVNNYKYINIHKYKNCLYKDNRNKIDSYIRHYCNKHNIKINSLDITIYKFIENNDNIDFIPTQINLYVDNYNKWLNILKLICNENDVYININN